MKIYINNKTKKAYGLVTFAIGDPVLVLYDGTDHWDHQRVSEKDRVYYKDINFDDWNLTKEELKEELNESKKSFQECLDKYQNSF